MGGHKGAPFHIADRFSTYSRPEASRPSGACATTILPQAAVNGCAWTGEGSLGTARPPTRGVSQNATGSRSAK